jgi:hypothetical protein
VVLCGAGLPPLLTKILLGGGSFGPSKTSALACVTATTTLAEARADAGPTCLRDGDDEDAGGGARGRRLSLARVMATTTLAEAHADVGSRLLA